MSEVKLKCRQDLITSRRHIMYVLTTLHQFLISSCEVTVLTPRQMDTHTYKNGQDQNDMLL